MTHTHIYRTYLVFLLNFYCGFTLHKRDTSSKKHDAMIETFTHSFTKQILTKRSLSELLQIIKPEGSLKDENYSEDIYELIQQMKKGVKSMHESWLDDLIDSGDNTSESIEVVISMYLQVSLGIMYTLSNPKGYMVFMDTGSSHAMLPLSQRVTQLTGTFKGIRTNNDLLFNNSIYYGSLVECPVIFKPGFRCTSAAYVSDASNSVVGVEEIILDKYKGASASITTEYKLNLLRGPSFGEIGIFGIGFGLRGFNTTPFLTPFYNPNGTQTILFQLTTNNKPFDYDYSVHKLVGTIKINAGFSEDEYKWTYFDKRGKNYSLNVMYGVYVSTDGSPGVHDMSDSEFDEIRSDIRSNNYADLKYNSFMFDSGTCGFILDTANTGRIIFGLRKIYRHMLLAQYSGSSVFVCWPDHDSATRHGFVPPSKVYLNILLEGIRASVSLKGMAFLDMMIEEDKYECLYILIMNNTPVQVIGYPIWKKLDLLWDANGGRVGLRSGVTND